MLKKMIVSAVALSATLAYGDININWFGSVGFFDNGTGPAPADPGDYIGSVFGSATAQLIWSPDAIVDNFDLANGANGWVENGEIVLNTITANAPYGDFDGGVSLYTDAAFGVTLDQGFVYSRIFGSAAPIAGEYFSASAVLNPALYDAGNPAADFLDHNTGAAVGDELNIQIVPEPSILAFLGLGGLVMAIRRVRK